MQFDIGDIFISNNHFLAFVGSYFLLITLSNHYEEDEDEMNIADSDKNISFNIE